MKNYMYVYHADHSAPNTPETMDVWNKWFETLGDKVVDSGNPITSAKMVLKDGQALPEKNDIIGYSIVKANSLDEAVLMAKDNPLASAPGCAVHVYETGQM
jgi:hypothetical protein